jgi:hypothetical protein
MHSQAMDLLNSVNSFSELMSKLKARSSESMVLTGASYTWRCLWVCPWRRGPCTGTLVPAQFDGPAPSQCCCNTYIRFQGAIHQWSPSAPARTHCQSPCHYLRPALSATGLRTQSLKPRSSACKREKRRFGSYYGRWHMSEILDLAMRT